ncbi:MAG TPA: diguanylate cyclase [Longimicrobiales bacterium]|nr:diguanylate cyclase [Longimicrobiales bacterium]
MTWSIQLSLWGLPPLLAILLVLNDGLFLWPRRREAGTPVLLALAAAVGVWALLDLIAISSASLAVKVATTRLEYAPAALAALAWLGFALVHASRKKDLSRWPMVLLYALAAASAGIALGSDEPRLLIQDARLVDLGGVMGLEIRHGPVHWMTLGVRFTAVLGATVVLSRHLARIPGGRNGVAWAGAAGVVALAPSLVQGVAMRSAEWVDLSSAGFALGGTLLFRGLMRDRLLHLGPVDRDLVLSELQDPIVVLDGRGRMVDVNAAARKELGLTPYGDVPVIIGTLWASGAAPPGAPAPYVILEDGQGEKRTYEVTLTRLDDPEVRGRAALLLRDVTVKERMQRELERAYADLERLARTDPLTGLANRRDFMERLEQEVERSDRYVRPLSLVSLDLDHFKSVNDTHGHAAGDEVLREAARALRSVCRDVDLAARMGGEELALLLPETDAAGARIVAERVRERIAGAAHRSPSGQAFRVTASLGVATARTGASGEALLQAADEALYRAKGAGRNQVVLGR